MTMPNTAINPYNVLIAGPMGQEQVSVMLERRRMRLIVSKKRVFSCLDCVFGKHEECTENGCSCVHHELYIKSETENQASMDSPAEEYCWPG
jgi:hypothetical protein